MDLTPPPIVWPLAALLIALLILRHAREQLSPLTKAVVEGLAKHSSRHALAYGMAILYAAAASLQALGDVAREQGWVYVEAFSRVVQPGCVAIIAFVRPSPGELNGTKPPFQQ